MVASGGAHGQVLLWDALAESRQLARLDTTGGTVWALAAYGRPDHGTVLVCALATGEVLLYDVGAAAVVAELIRPESPVRSLVTVVQNQKEVLVAGGCYDGTIQVWTGRRGHRRHG